MLPVPPPPPARFELAESLRSRLGVIILLLYGAGAAFGSWEEYDVKPKDLETPRRYSPYVGRAYPDQVFCIWMLHDHGWLVHAARRARHR